MTPQWADSLDIISHASLVVDGKSYELTSQPQRRSKIPSTQRVDCTQGPKNVRLYDEDVLTSGTCLTYIKTDSTKNKLTICTPVQAVTLEHPGDVARFVKFGVSWTLLES